MAATKNINFWKGIDLEARRAVMDPVADEVVKKIISNGEENIVNTVFMALIHNDQVPDGLPPEVAEYFNVTSKLPSWADNEEGRELIRRGERVYSDHGPEIALLLLCKSLPECYSCVRGAKVLYETGRLMEAPGSDRIRSLDTLKRRLMETSQYVVNVMSPGGLLSNEGRGIRSSQKVRLIHAAIRYFLKNRPEGWDAEQFGEPINQEDMCGTLLSFSALVIEGLITLGITLSKEDEKAFYYCWRVAGHFMGVNPDLLPETPDEGRALGHQVLDRNKGKSADGEELTKACIEFTESTIPIHTMDGVVEDLMRFLIGDEVSNLLGIREFKNKLAEKLPGRLQWLFHLIERFFSRNPILRRIASIASRLLMKGFISTYNDGKKVYFFIPPSLRDDWNITADEKAT